MEPVTPESLRAWRHAQGLTQEALGSRLGLKKVAITKIESGQRAISEPEQKLLQYLIHGRPPFSTPAADAQDARLAFTPKEWELIHRCARREGYDDAKRWIVDRIRGYLRMNPETAEAQLAAEEPAPYNP